MVLTVSFVLSPVTGLVSPRHRRCRQLDPSVGASGPHDFAVRSKHVVSAPLRPSHPVPTSVTFAKRPSEWNRTAGDIDLSRVYSEAEYFCKRGWTPRSANCLSGKSAGAAPRLSTILSCAGYV